MDKLLFASIFITIISLGCIVFVWIYYCVNNCYNFYDDQIVIGIVIITVILTIIMCCLLYIRDKKNKNKIEKIIVYRQIEKNDSDDYTKPPPYNTLEPTYYVQKNYS